MVCAREDAPTSRTLVLGASSGTATNAPYTDRVDVRFGGSYWRVRLTR